MIDIKDRVPAVGKANRVLITPEGGGVPFYATVTRADEPVEPGTPINRALFEGLYDELHGFDFFWGTYLGTGDTTRAIALPRAPELVTIIRMRWESAHIGIISATTDIPARSGSSTGSPIVLELTPEGFEISTQSLNYDGVYYTYFWR